MPKSKRDKKISLTQTKKKGLELKQKLIEEIRNCADKYARIFTFSVHNMRNVQLKEVRNDWHNSRFFFGKNKVMSLALGRTPEDECRDGIHKLSSQLHGQTGLLFTNKPKDEVLEDSRERACCPFHHGPSRSFVTASYTLLRFVTSIPFYYVLLRSPSVPWVITHGTIYWIKLLDKMYTGVYLLFSFVMSEYLIGSRVFNRQLFCVNCCNGSWLSLTGTVTLLREYKVCDKDDVLTPEQARILKLFGHMMAEFHITLEGMWEKNKWRILADRPEPIVPPKVTVRPKKKKDDDEEEVEADMEGDDVLDSDEET
ncbi:mRNA turnover protein 4 homolog [Argopecten irradians]|uniref:mRNA turnover protein 4 homolog n=1 Tax=Argopecten irradians TaxID=31199 RepID=UPI0037139BDF